MRKPKAATNMVRSVTVGLVVIGLFVVGNHVWAQSNVIAPSPHVFRIKASGCPVAPEDHIQSGFRVQDQVGIVTALHGVLGCDTLVAEAGGGEKIYDELIIGQVDIRHDIAILWSDALAVDRLDGLAPIAKPASGEQDERYQIIGYPLGLATQQVTDDVQIAERAPLGNLLDDAALVAIADRDSPGIDIDVFALQTPLVPSHSGAPLVNRAGEVVGVGNSGLDLDRAEVGWAIPWDAIQLQTIARVVSSQVSWSDFRAVTLLRNSPSAAIFHYDRETEATPEPPAVAAAVDLQILDEGLGANTYFVVGDDHAAVAVGDELIVLAEAIPGTEVAIALLRVTGKSPTALTAQAVLGHPQLAIRARMRVDNNLDYLSGSQLVPVYSYAAGYLLREGLVRLRPDHTSSTGDWLQVLQLERIDGEVIDALPTDTVMEITGLGREGQVAVVKLISGSWPSNGAIVSQFVPPTPTPTATA
ncbi:MAG: trypsin-like peptidase domain-containing protein, partial [Caldilineaceae bacterium]|nr:trypsin-like peptidase domain-containing protein [Caldilineaceae bacterium]